MLIKILVIDKIKKIINQKRKIQISKKQDS